MNFIKKWLVLLFPLIFSFFSASLANAAIATFAGGCFWCVQADFDKVPGVEKTIVGFTGGEVATPSYKQVSQGKTGHYEAVQVSYNPKKVSYQELLDVFWHNIDPTDASGQFCDKGNQYRAVIFYHNKEQKRLAIESKEKLVKSGRFPQVVTEILPAGTFYIAEPYHQKYYQKNPIRYKFYRYRCGRDQRLHELWGS
ncbi:peptide-methionine (S)-S-oxide reductase MsrA [Aquicella lusitana]|uniref:Peptide methionine sulfoxide reductase MsrA n=1 Tax=Aquicella lusitana TaxID=254246 RepID=A0A370GFL8_9COXI|nr:peptide-methionine (S)-S-oxide reductase MsrA [Aquicella lusitana]RDI42588.1 peptide-methionine (S)-S-oxide reductase [Aquicella lusitana]VVC74366.1 Peptide methionine sulfoxide reductase MsrA [Aquicella lusitana]